MDHAQKFKLLSTSHWTRSTFLSKFFRIYIILPMKYHE